MSPDCVPNWSGGKKGKKEALRVSGTCRCVLSSAESVFEVSDHGGPGLERKPRADNVERSESQEPHCRNSMSRLQ